MGKLVLPFMVFYAIVHWEVGSHEIGKPRRENKESNFGGLKMRFENCKN